MPVTGNTTGKPLSTKEIKIVESYLANPKAGMAKAFRTVHSDKNMSDATASNRASKFFKRGDVQEYLDRRKSEVREAAGVTYDYLVAQQKEVLEICMGKRTIKDEKGADTGKRHFNSAGANRAIETLGKLTGAFEEDNKQKGKAVGDAFGELMKDIAGASHKPGDF